MIKLAINIDVAAVGWKKSFPKMREKIEQAAAIAVLHAKKPKSFDKKSFEINILLSDDKTIKALNRDFRGMNKATNVLSFPQYTPPPRRRGSGPKNYKSVPDARLRGHGVSETLGDVILAFQTLKRECRAQKKTLENHCIHLVVHGVLHLFGYDHMKLKDAKTMEKLECDILASMGYPDPYHESVTKKAGR